MSEIALAKINSFASVAQQAEVSPSEPIFVLSSSQLQEIISQGVHKAIKTLQDDVERLKTTVANQEEIISLYIDPNWSVLDPNTEYRDMDIEAIKNKVEITKSYGIRILELEERLESLEASKKTKAEKLTQNQDNRTQILRSLLVTRGGKMLTRDARKIMKMDRGNFSRLVDSMSQYIESKPYHLDKRQTVLILKPNNRCQQQTTNF